MSLQDKLHEDAINEKIAREQTIQNKKETLYQLKGKRDFFESRNYLWFYKEFIENPYQKAREALDRETDTNKNFIYKGQVQAFKSMMLVKAQLNNEIDTLKAAIKGMETLQQESLEEKPEN